MSGPKVVRIVTREEILEICQGLLARVDAALAEWTRIGRRNDCIDDAAHTEAIRRRDALAALIAKDRFMDLQKQAPIEEGFLRDDMQRRLTAVAAEQAAARSRDRREREAATTLLRGLRSARPDLDAELVEGLERGDPSALAKGFQLLADGTVDTSAASRAAATLLRDEEPVKTLAEWIAAQPHTPTDPATERVETRLETLALLLDADTVASWRARILEAAIAPTARRALLLDGLEIETGRALTKARARERALTELQLTMAELKSAGLPAAEIMADIDTLDEATIVDSTLAARAAIESHRTTVAAEARRAAVLEGLSGLGYEVAEGMSTTWVADGRLVLRNATRPDYGLELGGIGDGGRMQMRAVAFETGGRGPEPSRDRDAETIWCGDVTSLDESLSKVGGGLSIERALPIGATPLKRIAVERPTDPGTTTAPPALRQRSLR
nr:hypothetical protein [uncultured Sphingomonas sp.]